jgi:hypothetical protein
MRTRSLLLAACCAALGCATAKPTSTSTAPPAAAAGVPSAVAPGLDAAEVRRRLGAPQRVERIPSAAAPGAAYERWSYRDREVVLLDGKVIDVVP